MSTIWDPSTVLHYIRSLPDNSQLSLLQLSKKCAMLIALATAQRTQTLKCLSVNNMTITKHAVTFVISDRLKQTVGDRYMPLIYLPKFEDRKICVWRCVLAYYLRTREVRTSNQLFVTSTPPYRAVSVTTVGRWIRDILQDAGVNTAVYKVHSTRSAASSKARLFLPLEKVLEAADWLSEKVFASHYCRELSSHGDFAQAVWQSL